ncbi:tetratricopeptide repeat protein [Streptomyces sp. NPDC018045]|uniref:tetratricopeptide repeat protein n=1 Tax=Streptomyces sp. NPDC018045 TaxID=3365037 RepID=UPI00379E3E95
MGRRSELSVFRESLECSPEDEAADFFFHVRGPGGVGKTTLVRRWEAIASEHGAATAYVGDAVADAVEVMEAITGQLARQGHGTKEFGKALSAYRQRCHEAEAATAVPQGDGAPQGAISGEPPEPGPSPGSMVVSQVGLAGLGMMPGAGPFVGAVDPAQVALGADRVRAAFAARFRNRDDAQMVLSPLQVLTPLFVRAVEEAAQRAGRVVLFFDTYEYTGAFLDVWLRDVLIEARYGELPVGVMVVAAGQSRLSSTIWSDHLDLVHELELEIFTEAEARQLLAAREIRDNQVIEVILRLSGRLPVLVHLLAEARPATAEDVGDPSGTAVERFLRWENDPARRAAALACALPLELDEDICRLLTGEEDGADIFGWLRGRPFVTDLSGRCRYHDVVRDTMLRLQRTQSPRQWQQQHTLLAGAYAQRRQHEEEGDDRVPEQWWDSQQWREYRLREIYHRLCAHPHRALPAALAETLHAYAHSTATLRRWAQILQQAGHDTDAPALGRWGRDFVAALEAEPNSIVSMLTRILISAGLSPDGRALAYALRGRERRAAGDMEAALADYTAALDLAPRLGSAYEGRGNTYFLTRRHDEALADYTRAIELNPDNPWPHIQRGDTYEAMDRYDDALTDYTRAIELNPDNPWAHTQRGFTYELMDRYDDALTDYTRAIELNPDNPWAHTQRGTAYRLMSRCDDALTDYTRAIELNPDDAWIRIQRGITYWSMGRCDDALTDYTRAIELDPDTPWAHTQRGDIYRLMDRYDDALTDYTRAIELKPSYARAHAQRGRTFQMTGRCDDALTDLTRAIELDPGTPWAHIHRGDTYEAMGRYDDALTDYTRAIELDPDDAWAYTRRGGTYEAMGRYDDALTDLTRAIELAPDTPWAHIHRGRLYRLMGRYEAALSELAAGMELDPCDAWGPFELAMVRRLLAQPGWESELGRAEELQSVAATGGSLNRRDELGGLFLIQCTRQNWAKAQQTLASFLRAGPPDAHLREISKDLEEIANVFALPADAMRSLHDTIHRALPE